MQSTTPYLLYNSFLFSTLRTSDRSFPLHSIRSLLTLLFLFLFQTPVGSPLQKPFCPSQRSPSLTDSYLPPSSLSRSFRRAQKSQARGCGRAPALRNSPTVSFSGFFTHFHLFNGLTLSFPAPSTTLRIKTHFLRQSFLFFREESLQALVVRISVGSLFARS